jgi:hypothetical protein
MTTTANSNSAPQHLSVANGSSFASSSGPALQTSAAWRSLNGAKGIQAELKQLYKDLPSSYPFIRNATPVGDNLHLWHLELCNFDEGSAGGKELNEDLRKLQHL